MIKMFFLKPTFSDFRSYYICSRTRVFQNTCVPEHTKKAQTSTVPLLVTALHGVTNIHLR